MRLALSADLLGIRAFYGRDPNAKSLFQLIGHAAKRTEILLFSAESLRREQAPLPKPREFSEEQLRSWTDEDENAAVEEGLAERCENRARNRDAPRVRRASLAAGKTQRGDINCAED